ncbi:hypothetical protein L6164_008426 [Bauhinia variegata]|uniref:Uncharacterized protein n=1 Tax=Bauhinia variegata TaxID=167791 RepID=A0ACB9PM82_BAUVA|nr:hypothetical protein L6164_008426 [Bauhinia variegata]
MAIKGGANKACAACKYQRRRCSKECPLSPYFPADQPKKFQNAHRLFGVSNIMKTLNQVHPEQHDEAMESIMFESDMRAKYPVHGCLGIIWQYNNQIVRLEEDLRHVKMQLAFVKDHYQYQLPYPMPPSPPDCSLVSPQQLQYGLPTTTTGDTAIPMYNHYGEFPMLDGNGVGVYNGSGYIENEDMMMKHLSVQQPFCNGMAMPGQPNLMAMQGLSTQQELDINPADYDDIPFDAIDDRQSFIECKEPCESSAESSFQEAAQHMENVSKNELKNAAACLSLKG